MNELYGNLPILNNQAQERLDLTWRVPLKEAALKLLQLSPLCLSVLGKNVFYCCPTGVGPWKRLHRPELLGLSYMGFKEHQSFKIFYEHQP